VFYKEKTKKKGAVSVIARIGRDFKFIRLVWSAG